MRIKQRATGRGGRHGLLVALLVLLVATGAIPQPDDRAGITWRPVRIGGGFASPTRNTGYSLAAVAWGDGKFVAVGGGGTIVHSGNADHWQEASAGATGDWLGGVAWGAGKFVAVGCGGTIVHSGAGDRWQEASAGATGDWLLAAQRTAQAAK